MKDYTVEPITYSEARPWLTLKHYARRMTTISYAFGLFESKILNGVITFGVGPGKNPFSYDLYEFNRLCLGENKKNIASFFVGKS